MHSFLNGTALVSAFILFFSENVPTNSFTNEYTWKHDTILEAAKRKDLLLHSIACLFLFWTGGHTQKKFLISALIRH